MQGAGTWPLPWQVDGIFRTREAVVESILLVCDETICQTHCSGSENTERHVKGGMDMWFHLGPLLAGIP